MNNQSNQKTGNLLDFDEPSDNNNNINVRQSNNDLLSNMKYSKWTKSISE